ncbi:murein biosynthesis integral membrane protein MurJ [Cytobacillus sp. NCCP-133]|uniref:murein biosynthesis integral membrane protein MurJ n=1 Tax=Cytobacillus sp. NCCP-133 TaxID=766848 RepID=UPI00222F4DB1|nr:murein biosynthesis integral membrane protein MurJ [Cytobacillus sp. NCCP-133]GLB60222.1 putative lipid II flippase MurJ [Cytobacillus sp. NCCP-133]
MKSKLLKIIGTVAVINILARLIGFAREVIIGYQYGTSHLADSIITAYTIPNFLYIVVGGAITTAFISVYSKTLDGKEKDLFISSVFSYIIMIIGVITVLMIVFAEPLLKALFGGMEREQFETTLRLFYWMAPSTFFLVVSMWLSGILNVHDRFQLSTMSTFIYNLGFVVLAVLLTPLMYVDSYGLGAMLSSIIMVAILLFGLRKTHLKFLKPNFAYSGEMKRLFLIAMPIMLGGATLQFYFLIQRMFASDLSEGYIAALNYASKLTQFPQAVLMTAVTTVIYPMLAKKVAANEEESVTSLYQRGLGALGLLLIPVTIFVFFYSKEIVQIIFEYGSFTEESSKMTIPLLQIFSLSMFALAGNVYISRFFYAKENSYMPVIISILCVFGINIIVTLALLDRLGAEAIAWGTSISSIVNFILLTILAKFMLKLRITENFGSAGKSLFLYAAIIIVMFLSSRFLAFGNPWIDLISGGVLFLAVFLVLLKIVRLPELQLILGRGKA